MSMSQEDIHRLAVAAADKEAAAFELDHAELNLQEAVVVALEHGTDVEIIAEVADLDPEEVLNLAVAPDEPALISRNEVAAAPSADPSATLTDVV